MPVGPPNSNFPSRTLKFAALFLGCALYAHYFATIRLHTAVYYEQASLPKLLAGTAAGPFQYRALFVWLIAAIQDCGWRLGPNHGLIELSCLIEAFVVLAIFAVTWLYLSLFIASAKIKAIGMLLLMFILSMTFLVPVVYAGYYVSDVPAILFFTLGLYLIHRDKMLPFYILYAVASLNRETFAFITVVYLLVNWHRPKLQVLISCAIQAAILIATRAFMLSIYGCRAQGQITLLANIDDLSDPYLVFQVLSSVGFLWVFPVLCWRLISDPFARRACLVLPVFGTVAFCMANTAEIRVFGELTPIILPATLLVMQRLFREAAPTLTTAR